MRRMPLVMMLLVLVLGLVGLTSPLATPAYAQEPPPESGEQVSGTLVLPDPVQQGQTLVALPTLTYDTSGPLRLRVYYPTDWGAGNGVSSTVSLSNAVLDPWDFATKANCTAPPTVVTSILGVPVDCVEFTLPGGIYSGFDTPEINIPVGATAVAGSRPIRIQLAQGNVGNPPLESVTVSVTVAPSTFYAANTPANCPVGTTVGVDCFTGTTGLQDAVNAASAGQTVLIVNGYRVDGQVTIDKNLTVRPASDPTPATVFSDTSASCFSPMLETTTTSTVTIQNLIFDGNDVNCIGGNRLIGIFANTGQQLNLNNVTVQDFGAVGLDVGDAGVTVTNSTFDGIGEIATTGINIGDFGSNAVSISNSTFTNWDIAIADASDRPVTIGGGNVIGAPGDENVAGIDFSGSGGTKTVTNNTIADNNGNGLVFADGGGTFTITDNTVSNNALGMEFSGSGTYTVYGNTVTSNSSQAFVQNSGTLNALGNNFNGNTTEGATRIGGSGEVRKNYWTDTPQPGGTTDLLSGFTADDWLFRLGAPVQAVAYGPAGSVTLDDLGGSPEQASLTGGTGAAAIISMGAGTNSANVPFGKFDGAFGSNRCSDYFDFYVLPTGSGTWTATVPTYNTAGCTAVTEAYAFDTGEDAPAFSAACTHGGQTNGCYWEPVEDVLTGGTLSRTGNTFTLAGDASIFAGPQIVAGDNANTDPTSISLIGFAAQPGSTQMAALLPAVAALLLLVAGSAGVLLLRRPRR